ncbi:MAG: ferrous iron transport protein A [Anaerolineaceae bacterium]|jgi:ferrous iron transport protein A|nr:FeoA family protein [Cyclobacteriaceae bacterium]
MQGELKSLNELVTGTHALIHHFSGGKEFKNRLLVLGFTIGTEVVVWQNFGSGPIIIAVKDSHVALGRGEAKKVIAEILS